jgi:RNA polymerase sigma-70 factor (ECF subfamily)
MHLRPGSSPPLAEWSDEDLILAYQDEGNRRAFEELVHRYERELYNYLRRFLGHAEMAEEVFQNTFLQVHLKCDQFQPGRRLRPWLYTIATNQAIDAQRRNRRHKMVSLDRRGGDSSGDQGVGALIGLLESSEPHPAERFESAQWRERIAEAVDELAEPLRLVVELVYFQGLKYREAADVLSIPVGTVKSRLHTAIYKLNRALTDPRLPQKD